MSKYSRKKVVPPTAPPDEFVGFWQRFWRDLAPQAPRLAVLVGGALVLGLIAWGGLQLAGSRREKATDLLTQALLTYQAELLGDKDTAPGPDETPRFKSAKERADATLAVLDKLGREYGGSDAARRGLLVRAGVLYDQARYDEADAAYHKFLEGKPDDPLLGALAREGLGLDEEARGKLDAALGYYKDAAPFYKDRSLADQARVYVKKGDKKQAADLYREILKSPQSVLHEEAENRLASLEN